MRIFFAAILSFATLVGGHFINRRFDRVVMFFGLALLILVAWGVSYTLWMTNVIESGNFNENSLEGFPMPGFYLTGLGIWLGSVITTVTDGIRRRPDLQQKWSASGVIGAVSLSLTAACLVGYYAWISGTMVMSLSDNDPGTTPFQSSWKQANNHFSQYIYFDWVGDSEKVREPLPTGSGAIVGRFLYDGEPAQGVKLSVLFAGGYETKTLTTDEMGKFEIPVKPGSWTIKLVKVSAWADKPSDKSLIVTTGFEPSVGEGKYSRSDLTTRGKGLEVHVPEGEATPAMEFEIREHMALRWPDSTKGEVSTQVDTGVVKWAKYPRASQYQVKISEVERRDDGATYTPIIARNVVDDTQFPLAHLTSVSDEEKEREYSVEVYAFDENGAYLSESDRGFRNSDIKLTDNKRLVPDTLTSILPTASLADEKELQKAFANRKRLAAIKVLIEDGLLDAGEDMINSIDGPTEPGELEALTGYLFAKKNQCEEARQWFDRALASGGRSCVPSSYKVACE